MERTGRSPSEDNDMEGECHFPLNKEASKFFSVKCDIYNRRKSLNYNFFLESITSFDRQAF